MDRFASTIFRSSRASNPTIRPGRQPTKLTPHETKSPLTAATVRGRICEFAYFPTFQNRIDAMILRVPYLRPLDKSCEPHSQAESRGKRAYKQPDRKKIADLVHAVGSRENPAAYAPDLAEFAATYRVRDALPNTPRDKLVAKPRNDTFRMFPEKCRQALSLASPDAKLVFHALWDQYEEKNGRANGLLFATLDYLQAATRIGRRHDVSTALIELEVRGLVRIARGRAGGGRSYSNLALLTAFPDALGNPATADYVRLGLPEWSKTADAEKRRQENEEIEARFRQTIRMHIELTRFTRNTRGENA